MKLLTFSESTMALLFAIRMFSLLKLAKQHFLGKSLVKHASYAFCLAQLRLHEDGVDAGQASTTSEPGILSCHFKPRSLLRKVVWK